MRFFFEHRSIGIALQSVPGEDTTEAPAGDAGGGAGVIVVGWSSKETLLLRPEFAWLSRPGFTYLRLPLSRTAGPVLRASQVPPLIEAASYGNLPPPGEQWGAALEQLLADVRAGARERSRARVVELRRYATANWPGWYDDALRAVQRAVEEEKRAEELIEGCRTLSAVVESVEAVAQLLRWSETEVSRQAAELVREVASYAQQGALELQECRRAISEEPAWRDLERRCAEAQAALTRLGRSGRPVDVRVKGSADEVCDGVKELLGSWTDANVSLDECAASWTASVERISSALRSLARLRDWVRESLPS